MIMAFSGSLLTEDQLQCSICLDVFTDPVSTPCGHNYCMICLRGAWDSSSHCRCLVCKKDFSKRPELRVNTFISGLAAQFKKQIPLKPKKVLCDSCTEEKLEAVKSCLHCGVSFCNTHLITHITTAKLMKHKLMEPVENLEDYICQKHERPLELFCRDCQTCVCQFCTEGHHRTHHTVPVEEESKDNKTELWMIHAGIQQMIQDLLKKIQEIKHSTKLYKNNTEKEKIDSVEIFSALMICIVTSLADLPKVMEKEKATERQAEEFIKDLKQEITELKRRNTELEQLSHTEDHLHLLQIYPSLCSPPHTQDWTDVTINSHLSVESLRRKIMQELLNNAMEKFVHIELKRIQQHAVDVILDPDTANPCLSVSNDGKEVTCENIIKKLPDNPERFDRCICVLGKEGFSSGRFYYEVDVKGKTKWDLGVVRETVNRKGNITACPENGFWCVSWNNQVGYVALDSASIPLSSKQPPQKVGVFVDYEEGLVSFYNVEAKHHMYSFTGQTFTEKLYPFFSPGLNEDGGNSVPLIIYPWAQNQD
ncbi:E3 ubiquitin-protein ligase TRIM39-like [Clarias gariepinus]|uniref:E3 ubiquitin-protein ligase TRIM39-like n=1 Tax=Clarias gariepinus TaxID=13013 RepID=UPI00234D88A2|nr:E3 ubiquitin-protein ligase TRIM39-like [Clarias gariepinus]